MLKKSIFLTLLLSFHAVALSQIGIESKQFTDNNRSRTISTYILYPTNEASTPKTYAQNTAFWGFEAIENAPISSQKLPLYIMVHGTSGNWRNLSWLASKLAKEGAIVVSANHPDYTSGNATPDSVIKMWNQPKDVSFIIDSMLKTTTYGNFINKEKIAVIGYSLGGYTALALAGAQLDMHKYVDFCSHHQDKACNYFKPTFNTFNKQYYTQTSQPLTDQRINATISIAPGFVESMTSHSLTNIKVPSLIIGAEQDKNLPPSTHFKPYISDFSANIIYQEIADASHFSFMQQCRPKAPAILAEEGAAFVCMDGKKKSRKEIHNELYLLISNFIQEKLQLKKHVNIANQN
ncbi:alpha/beta hydrolase family protein [Zooshikella sp. RANM57]|uniref:alpha/beta hydrolase family protein n=1 Tax=Zooshikella sp. RANM57 TaxID=3425863 RepID=UPI003D6EB94A